MSTWVCPPIRPRDVLSPPLSSIRPETGTNFSVKTFNFRTHWIPTTDIITLSTQVDDLARDAGDEVAPTPCWNGAARRDADDALESRDAL